MAYFAPIKAKDVWEYIARTLTSAENITSDGNPIDQSKIANLDVAVSTRSSHSPADVWSYSSRTLTSAENITSDGNPIDQSKIAKLDATISSRMSNQYESKLPKLDYLDVAVSTRSSHSPADVWSYSKRCLTNEYIIVPSDTVQISADTERYTNSTDYVTKKKIRLLISGTVRAKYEIRTEYRAVNAGSKLYLNDTEIYNESTPSETWVLCSCDFDVSAGDIVSVKIMIANSSYRAYVRNFRICYDVYDSNEVLMD